MNINEFWTKILAVILTTGILAVIAMTYEITGQTATIHSDVSYIKETIKDFNERLTRLEHSAFTSKDGEQLKTWTELKLEALKIQIQSNKTEMENLKDLINALSKQK